MPLSKARWRSSSLGTKAGKQNMRKKDLAIELEQTVSRRLGIFVKLHAGQAVFLKANEPHAYFYGDIMECMATSDKPVLRRSCGTFPTLTSMLADSQIIASGEVPFDESHYNLRPTLIEKFSVLMMCLKAGGDNETQEPIEGPSILIVTEGSGRLVWTEKNGSQKEESLENPGIVYFVGAGVALSLVAGEGGMTVYRTIAEVP